MANEVTIDELRIEIEAESGAAASNLDKLAQSIDRLQAVTSRITGGNAGLNKIAKQIEKLNSISASIQSMQGFEKLERAVNSLKKLNELNNIGDISGFVRNLNKLPQAMNAIAQMPSIDASKFQQLADAMKPLQSVDTSGLNSMLNALRKLPKVSQELANVDFAQLTQQITQLSTELEPIVRQAERGGAGLTALAQIMQQTSRTARQSSNGVNLFNTAIGNIKVKTLAAIAGLRRLLGLFKSSITASNEYVENLNLFTVTMGEGADEALRFANNVNELMGIDVSQWIQNQGIFKQMASGFGMMEQKATLLSKNLTQLGYDISSYYNISVEDAMQKLQSAMAGEQEPLRRLGYALDEATLKQVALNHGITQSVTDMSQAQKAQLRYIAIMEQSTNAMGDMARTIDSPSNQLRILESRILTLKRAIGDSLMPVVSAVLPYLTALVQILGETFRSIAEFMGFELPVFDYSDLKKGGEDIAASFEDATKASKEFKGTLAGIDQLNIIGSKDEGKGNGNENQFDLGIDLPEYDFLQGIESKTKEIAENIKNWFKEALPWIEAVGTAIAGAFAFSKIGAFTEGIKNIFSLLGKDIGADKLKGFSKTLGGIVGGLAAGATSGVLFYNSIKNLITGTGKLGNNIAMLTTGLGVAGGALALFIKTGNKAGVALTAGLAAYGIASGVLEGFAEKTRKAGQEIFDSMIYNNGGTKISKIATAFEDWANAAIEVNNQTIEKYAQLDRYDSEMSNLRDTMTEIAGVDLKLDEIAPADAAKLKEPFDSLIGYLNTEFKERVNTAAQSVADAFKNLGLSEGINAEMQASFKSMQRLFDTTLTDTQKVVDEYLDRMSQGEKLTEAETQEFTKEFNLAFDLSTSNTDLRELERAIDEIDLSKIDLEGGEYALEALDKIQAASETYVQSAKDRLQIELDNTAEMRRKLDVLKQYGKITDEEYNSQIGLINLSENLFGLNYQKQIEDVRTKVQDITGAVNSQLNKAANDAVAAGAKAQWNEKLYAWLNDLDDVDSIVKGRLLGENGVFDANIALSNYATKLSADVEFHNTYADESTAQQWAIMLKETQPYIDIRIGRMQDETGQMKYIVGDQQSLIDAKITEIKSETEGWKILMGEKTAQIKAEFSADTDLDYDKIKKTYESLAGYSVDWTKFRPPLADTSDNAKYGYARKAYSDAAQEGAVAVQGAGMSAAEFVIHNYVNLDVDGETIAESVTQAQHRQMMYSNGR